MTKRLVHDRVDVALAEPVAIASCLRGERSPQFAAEVVVGLDVASLTARFNFFKCL
ncbi:MAG: hypothetical protein ACREYE_12005 [Gammaproteobacteria bacterium]